VDFPYKKVVVTGGSGFLGRFVVEKLNAYGDVDVFVPRSREYNLIEGNDVKRLLADTKPDMVNIAVDQLGNISIDKKPYNFPEVASYLSNKFSTNASLPVYIAGNEEATHGMIINVLDLVKSVGIQNVSFAIAPTPPGSKPK